MSSNFNINKFFPQQLQINPREVGTKSKLSQLPESIEPQTFSNKEMIKDFLNNKKIDITGENSKIWDTINKFGIPLSVNNPDRPQVPNIEELIGNSTVDGVTSVVSEMLISTGAGSISLTVLNALSDALITYLQDGNEIPTDNDAISKLIIDESNGFAAFLNGANADGVKIPYTSEDLNGAAAILQNFAKNNAGSDGNGDSLTFDDLTSAYINKSIDNLNNSTTTIKQMLTSSGGANIDNNILNHLTNALIEYSAYNDIPNAEYPTVKDLIDNGFSEYLNNNGVSFTQKDLDDSTVLLSKFVEKYASNDGEWGSDSTLSLIDLNSAVKTEDLRSMDSSKDLVKELLAECGDFSSANNLIANSTNAEDNGAVLEQQYTPQTMSVNESKSLIKQILTSSGNPIREDVLDKLADAIIEYIPNAEIPANQVGYVIDALFTQYLSNNGINDVAETDMNAAKNMLGNLVDRFSNGDGSLSLQDLTNAVNTKSLDILTNQTNDVKNILKYIGHTTPLVDANIQNALIDTLYEYLSTHDISQEENPVQKIIDEAGPMLLSKLPEGTYTQQDLENCAEIVNKITHSLFTNEVNIPFDEFTFTSLNFINKLEQYKQDFVDDLNEFCKGKKYSKNSFTEELSKFLDDYCNKGKGSTLNENQKSQLKEIKKYLENYVIKEKFKINKSDIKREISLANKIDLGTNVLKSLSEALVEYLPNKTINESEIGGLIKSDEFKTYLNSKGVEPTDQELNHCVTILQKLAKNNVNNTYGEGDISLNKLSNILRNQSAYLINQESSKATLQDILQNVSGIQKEQITSEQTNMFNHFTTALTAWIQDHDLTQNSIDDLIDNKFSAYLNQLPDGKKITLTPEFSNICKTTLNNIFNQTNIPSLTMTEMVNAVKASKINGVIDEHVFQRSTGDCWAIAGILSLASTPAGANIIKEAIHKNDDGSVTVTFKGAKDDNGNPVTITFTEEEVDNFDNDYLRSSYFTRGDNDMLVLEMAIEKAYEQYNYNPHDKRLNIEGGYAEILIDYLTGKPVALYELDENGNIKKDSNGKYIRTGYGYNTGEGEMINDIGRRVLSEEQCYEVLSKATPNTVFNAGIYTGKNSAHGIAITNVDKENKTVTLVNPWYSDKPVVKSWDELSGDLSDLIGQSGNKFCQGLKSLTAIPLSE